MERLTASSYHGISLEWSPRSLNTQSKFAIIDYGVNHLAYATCQLIKKQPLLKYPVVSLIDNKSEFTDHGAITVNIREFRCIIA